jgi:hypothetical protein
VAHSGMALAAVSDGYGRGEGRRLTDGASGTLDRGCWVHPSVGPGASIRFYSIPDGGCAHGHVRSSPGLIHPIPPIHP